MFEILARPGTRREACVKSRHKTPICQPFCQFEGAAPVEVQVRISANHHLYSALPRGPDRLPRTLVVPAIHNDGVKFLFVNDSCDFRRVETAKPAVPRRLRDILQEGMC